MSKRKRHVISLIIPSYNQEKTIVSDLNHIQDVMSQLRYDYEMIVVVDGMKDKTYQRTKRLQSQNLTITGYKENHGKGYAVRFGMAKAKGDTVAFLDAGMDIDPNGISMLLEHFEWYKADIIVGSKLHPVSKVNYPFSRKVLSWGYRLLVRVLFGFSIRDTQVGMKFFRREVLQDVLPRLMVKTYAFDVEMLAVAYRLGYRRIFEAPIELDFKGASTLASKGFWKVIMLMLLDTLAVFYRLRIMRYYDKKHEQTI